MNKQINIADINIEIINSKDIPNDYLLSMFTLEYQAFSKVYKMCPKTKDEYTKRYHNKVLIIILLKHNRSIVGFRVFEVINLYQVQSMVMLVKESYRKNGLANLICSVSANYLRHCKYKFIGSWTHINITASKILSNYAPYLNTNSKLSSLEIRLLNNLLEYWGKDIAIKGKRQIPDFYDMLNPNQKGDANFWVHKL